MSPTPRKQSPLIFRWFWPMLVVVALVIAAWWFLAGGGAGADAAYRTAPVERGEIRAAISATGTLSATATIEIGTQVSGMLQSVEVDFNDAVAKDQVIARIDPSTFQARLEQASATLSSARAGLSEAQAVARNAELDYTRKADLLKRQLIARTDADQSLAARDQARARIVSARAQVRQQQATVDSAKLDMEKTVIRSPVDGVVLLRAVEPGQTVAASLQTPVLFKIAGDLRKMEIVLAIDEADIGQVREGQTAQFTVDAFPDRNFSGRVKQVRLAATNTANVITYPVVVQVANPDQSLLPGMTANAEIEINRRPNVLSVPNAALRFRPAKAGDNGARGSSSGRSGATSTSAAQHTGDGNNGGGTIDALGKIAIGLQLEPRQREAFEQSQQAMRDLAAQRRSGGSAMGVAEQVEGRSRGGSAAAGSVAPDDRGQRTAERIKQNFAAFRALLNPAQQATWDSELAALTAGSAPVYRLVDGKLRQVIVRIGASDGTRTEIISGELAESDLVIIGSARPTP